MQIDLSLDHATDALDMVAGGTIVATWLGHLPDIAAGVALLYTVMRIVIEWPRLMVAIKGWFR